jgi:hypothetical protein
MSVCRAVFTARDAGLTAELDVSLNWPVLELYRRLESLMGIEVHSLKFNRREILDTDRLDALGLGPNPIIFVNSQTLAPTSVPSAERVRRATGCSPEELEERIHRLEELGFERELCVKALKSASYCIHRAARYLLSGWVPEPLGPPRALLSSRKLVPDRE